MHSKQRILDTSIWIEFLRDDGDQEIKSQVERLLLTGNAVMTDVVLLELWNGAGNQRQKSILRKLEKIIHCLDSDRKTFAYAVKLSQKARSAGCSLPITDILIFAVSQIHEVPLMHKDKHFEVMQELI